MPARQSSVILCRQIVCLETQACILRFGAERDGRTPWGTLATRNVITPIPFIGSFMSAAIAV
jgi:hypothetical protein